VRLRKPRVVVVVVSRSLVIAQSVAQSVVRSVVNDRASRRFASYARARTVTT
jgi:uncharacterized membrane protein